MSAFKDMMSRDRRAVFLNSDEFGETHRIAGREIIVVMDNQALKERQGGAELGVAESCLLFYAAIEDLPAPQAPGSGLNVNGREYIVDDWSVDMDIATIVLRQQITR